MDLPATVSVEPLHRAIDKLLYDLKSITNPPASVKKLIEILENVRKMTDCGTSMEFDISGPDLKKVAK
jgi:hypothetical protein